MNKLLHVDTRLIHKYNQPIPRYTSYPTVPFWQEQLQTEEWKRAFKDRFDTVNSEHGISIYIHLPFCESLCTYCGCNKKITTNHTVEKRYIAALAKEWQLYRSMMNKQPVINGIHLGGGTPTFFSAEHLQQILNIILKDSVVHPHHEFSIEGHPNNTTTEQMQVLYDNGFRRISFGVQDNDPVVQKAINRIQPLEQVKKVTEEARRIGFLSVNYDLIYGLPFQTTESIKRTIAQVMQLRPDRIAFYSYAHVPWTSKAQRLFDEKDLPDAAKKVELYIIGKNMLLGKGYVDIGMDHFALPTDEMYTARQEGKMHRNFMGYTILQTGMLLGLGVSAISDLSDAYAQNEKALHDYYAAVEAGNLPIKKGYMLSAEDRVFKKHIIEISCIGKTNFTPREWALLEQYSLPLLESLQDDGLIVFDHAQCTITTMGHYFIRNICSAFDLYLQRNKQATARLLFSKAM